MESASRDVLVTIALNSELPDLLRWCVSNSKIYQKVCSNDYFWKSKLLKDYPNYEELGSSFLSSPSTSLKEKYVFMYQLTYIKKLIDTYESLKDIFLRKKLFLSRKNLERVPAFNLPNLKELRLDNNQLTEVPAFNLPNLEELRLDNNQLTEVPNFNLPNLKVLHLGHNQLTEVPNFNLPALKELRLDYNQLTKVPIFNLPALQTLSLSNNQLTEVPEFHFPNLRYFQLNHNQLTEASKLKLKKIYSSIYL